MRLFLGLALLLSACTYPIEPEVPTSGGSRPIIQVRLPDGTTGHVVLCQTTVQCFQMINKTCPERYEIVSVTVTTPKVIGPGEVPLETPSLLEGFAETLVAMNQEPGERVAYRYLEATEREQEVQREQEQLQANELNSIRKEVLVTCLGALPEGAPLAWVTFKASFLAPSEAKVIVDGRPIGRTPLRLPMAEGEHKVLFLYEDGARQVRVFEVVRGESLEVVAEPPEGIELEEESPIESLDYRN